MKENQEEMVIQTPLLTKEGRGEVEPAPRAVLSYFFQTHFRTFLVGSVFGAMISIAFLFLSLKVADPTLTYNPYRWISKPHEWLMLVGLVLETKVFIALRHLIPTLSQVLVLFCLAHVLAGMVVYGFLALILRAIVLQVQRFTAKRP